MHLMALKPATTFSLLANCVNCSRPWFGAEAAMSGGTIRKGDEHELQ
jgi:hypothetical protein